MNSLLCLLVQYQMEMMRSLRHVNIDHLHVGWYQSTYYGSFVTRALLDSQFSYQHAIEESVVLIYGQQEAPLLFFSSLNIITAIFAFCLSASWSSAGRPSQVNISPVLQQPLQQLRLDRVSFFLFIFLAIRALMCTFWNAGVAASFFSSSPSLPPCRGWWNETRCLTNPDCWRVWFCT